jgi:hypothetical protein
MTSDALATLPSKGSVALVDLVASGETECHRAMRDTTARVAKAARGRLLVASQAVAPMIAPHEPDLTTEETFRLLLVSHYPSGEALRKALGERNAADSAFADDAIRTYFVRSAPWIQSFIGRTLPHTLGRFGREDVPHLGDDATRDELIQRALILGEQPDAARWRRLVDRSKHQPIWMLNFLHHRETALYDDHAGEAAPDEPISGFDAYQRYGQGMFRSLAAVGGRVAWSGFRPRQIAGGDDGQWDQVAIAVYPSAAAMMTMLAPQPIDAPASR